jgi:hypothetical protein
MILFAMDFNRGNISALKWKQEKSNMNNQQERGCDGNVSTYDLFWSRIITCYQNRRKKG